MQPLMREKEDPGQCHTSRDRRPRQAPFYLKQLRRKARLLASMQPDISCTKFHAKDPTLSEGTVPCRCAPGGAAEGQGQAVLGGGAHGLRRSCGACRRRHAANIWQFSGADRCKSGATGVGSLQFGVHVPRQVPLPCPAMLSPLHFLLESPCEKALCVPF